MREAQEIEKVRSFIKRYAHIGLLSTGARPVDFDDDLYNVKGSTDDPRQVPEHVGLTWKQLLVKRAGLGHANCYVTNSIPDEVSSHPNFGVGGHMTPNSAGIVGNGDISYLMPLCKWHNSTSRNDVAFEHTETRMLELTGFMEGDLAVTFAIRLPSEEQHSLLYFDRGNGSWEYRDLGEEVISGFNKKFLSATVGTTDAVQEYVLF